MPNIYEAKLLSGLEIRSKEDIENSARKIIGLGAKAVLIKGGGLKDMKGKDFFLDLNGKKELINYVFKNCTFNRR